MLGTRRVVVGDVGTPVDVRGLCVGRMGIKLLS